MREENSPNSRIALAERRDTGRLTCPAPLLMLFARSGFTVAAQGLVAALYAARGSLTPWRDAEPWMPVYGSLIDLGCLGLLAWLSGREGITLIDLFGFDRRRWKRDVLLGLALVPPSLVIILGGNFASSLLVYGNLAAPDILPSTRISCFIGPCRRWRFRPFRRSSTCACAASCRSRRRIG